MKSGPDLPWWKGGVSVNADGYLQIRAGPLRGTYVHRWVLEAKLGRPLAPDEECHHINGDKLDCRPENLEAVHVDEHRAFLNGSPRRWGKVKPKSNGEAGTGSAASAH